MELAPFIGSNLWEARDILIRSDLWPVLLPWEYSAGLLVDSMSNSEI